MHVAQPETALAAARTAVPSDPWRLGAVHSVTTLTGSALIALALARGRLTADEAWAAAHVDEDWNMEQWGRDDAALERRAFVSPSCRRRRRCSACRSLWYAKRRFTAQSAAALAARDAHVARERGPLVAAVDDEIVALGLARNRLVDGGIEEIVPSEARSGVRRSAASSWPRHM